VQSDFKATLASLLKGSVFVLHAPSCETEKVQCKFPLAPAVSGLCATQGNITIVINGLEPTAFTSVMNCAESLSVQLLKAVSYTHLTLPTICSV